MIFQERLKRFVCYGPSLAICELIKCKCSRVNLYNRFNLDNAVEVSLNSSINYNMTNKDI